MRWNFLLIPLSFLPRYKQAAFHKITKREVDRGPEYGGIWIKNSCNYNVYFRSEGAWERDDDHSEDINPIYAGETHYEVYRQTCPKPPEHSDMKIPPNCPELNKMEGQGISIKITDDSKNLSNILQLEYALVQNPQRHDNFVRLDYDISLLNCAVPRDNITDIQAAADEALNRKKIEGCPGYHDGLGLWFDNHELCRPIFCDGVTYCDGVYNYDKTREGEMSLACHNEYRGDMHFELCAGNGNG